MPLSPHALRRKADRLVWVFALPQVGNPGAIQVSSCLPLKRNWGDSLAKFAGVVEGLGFKADIVEVHGRMLEGEDCCAGVKVVLSGFLKLLDDGFFASDEYFARGEAVLVVFLRQALRVGIARQALRVGIAKGVRDAGQRFALFAAVWLRCGCVVFNNYCSDICLACVGRQRYNN